MKKYSLNRLSAILLLSLCITQAFAKEKKEPSASTEFNYGTATELGIIKNEELIELSGIVSGGVNKDVLWVHNDRHNLPRLYALNLKGETVGTYSLDIYDDKGMMGGDWEDIAILPGAKEGSFDLYLGDIGNNPMKIAEHKLLIVSEPVLETKTPQSVNDIEFKSLRFEYPDGYICNSECLLANPITRKIFIVTKAVKRKGSENDIDSGRSLWALPAVKDYEQVHTARLVMKSIPHIEGKITGGDISPDGQHLILRTITDAYLWKIEEKQTLEEVLRSPPKKIVVTKGGKPRGGEAICFSRDKSHLFAVYDGKKKNRPLHGYPALSSVH